MAILVKPVQRYKTTRLDAPKKKYILYCFFLLLLCTVCPRMIYAQGADSVVVERYFASIKTKESLLRQFFAEMPKGGDLHNHFSGAVYAESYFKYAVGDRLCVDMKTGKLLPSSAVGNVQKLNPNMSNLHETRMELIDRWSIRNFNPCKDTLGPDEHFFRTFGLFGIAASRHKVEMLKELRERAAKENVQYLEIMLVPPGISRYTINKACNPNFYDIYNDSLKTIIRGDSVLRAERLDSILARIYHRWDSLQGMQQLIDKYIASTDSIDRKSFISVGTPNPPICRYQGYASRNSDPLTVYAQLYVSFKACQRPNSKLVGVNIVSAENKETALEDYSAHMRMFHYLDSVTGDTINTSLHAGELAPGLVEPETLRDHIRQAVLVAGADRIGHGVDVASEEGSIALLDTMRQKQVAVEINLTSNEFILGVKDDAHPFSLYRKAGVPVVISTDDPGILRTDLTQQYVLAVLRYGLGYYEIKQLVRNSIRFSFLPAREKQLLLNQIEMEFGLFENKWRKYIEANP